MAEKQKPLNPYIAGSALDGPAGFFGRADILGLVESELRTPQQNAVVLFGQRRIGKTSILLQLRRHLAESGFVPVYLDLMDRARRPLGAVLAELAGEAALALGLEPPEPERFDDEGRTFRQAFLPAAYEALGEGEAAGRLVFLFDEFDVLDTAAAEELPDTAAARAFFPYLRELMTQEKRLGFVIVVGRKTEELSTDFRAAFRAARYQRVSVLEEEDARALIHLAEEAGTLRFTAPAEQRILALTAGHPYFTQLTCFVLFGRAWAGAVEDVPQVTKADVDAVVPQVLEAGNNAFEWVWDGLPPAERIIFSAIAEGTEEGQVLDEDQIVEVLQEHGIRILIRELELAPRTLVEWEMLCRVDGGYRFFIELMRRWVDRHKPLARVRDELDRVDIVADQLYRLGLTYYRQENLEAAVEQLREAVTANPNHLQARLLLGQCLRELGDLSEAIKELEWAYEYDAQVTRYELVRTLLQQGERLEKGWPQDEALAVYDRILEISPRERVARERRAAIYEGRGDSALKAGEFDAALRAYEQAGNREKIEQAAARKRQIELEAYAQRGEEAAATEDWAAAVEVYEWLASEEPENARWREALDEARREQHLEARYTAGLGAVEQGQWDLAQRALAEVVHGQPDYKEASRYLYLAVAGQDPADLQADLVQEREARQELAQELEKVKAFPFRYLTTWGWVAMAALVVALLAIGGLVGALLTREPSTGAPVVIVSPPSNSKVLLGSENEVVIVVRAGEGVTQVELEVDGVVKGEYPAEGGEFLYDSPVSLGWTADSLGERTLTVKPLDRNNQPGESVSIFVEVVEPTPAPTNTPPPSLGSVRFDRVPARVIAGSQTEVTIAARDSKGQPMQGVKLLLWTEPEEAGQLEPAIVVTGVDGEARSSYINDGMVRSVILVAEAEGQTEILGQSSLDVVADINRLEVVLSPPELYANGADEAILDVLVLDALDTPLTSESVTLTITPTAVAWFLGDQRQLITGTHTVATDEDGRAQVICRAGTRPGKMMIFVEAAGQVMDISLTVEELRPESLTIEAVAPTEIVADGRSIPLLITVLDQRFEPLPGVAVTLTMEPVGIGKLAGSVVTDDNGRAIVLFTDLNMAGNVNITATVEKIEEISAAIVLTLIEPTLKPTEPAKPVPL